MSAKIKPSTKDIYLTKGDTLKCFVKIKTLAGELYEIQSGDSVRFAMKRYPEDVSCLITKNINTSTLVLEITPSDTESLEVGRYIYDLQLTTAGNEVYTFIGPANFFITEEVE